MIARVAKKPGLWKKVLIFFSLVGPGVITGSVDNDAGGITTYSVAGALYGYNLLWTLIPAFIVLLIIQEMNARMGVVTEKGLADLIRENAGVKVTFFHFSWFTAGGYKQYDDRICRGRGQHGDISCS
ncbi:divalent metal cation transporter [Bacillus sp. EB600]|uniref:divalent metal cation transporter n=1 Tax=Bacillus sp. EB600 TaxID=2806345 RepID=UPI00210D2058|nr:divalent metal cation transporter [Bacillus sp. EB600]MCQ6282205.1 divalent metal cation transporter [Bacillus sp. EB600]